MNATFTRSALIALAIAAAPAMLPIGAAQAAPVDHTPRITVAVDPLPEPPSIGNPNDRPGVSVALGGPDTAPGQRR